MPFRFYHRLGQNNQPRPLYATTFVTLLALVLYAVILAILANFRSTATRIVAAAVGSLLFLLVLGWVGYDIRADARNGGRTLSPNLVNTVLTATLTIGLLTGLYCGLWYPARISTVLELSQDVVPHVVYPSVAVFQQNGWAVQANLHAGYSECFVGYYNKAAPNCTDMNPNAVDGSGTCRCANLWSDTIREDFSYHNASYRYLEFSTNEKLMCTRPTTLLLLQAFFDYNLDEAEAENDFQPSPLLSIAVFDSRLNLTYALEHNFTHMLDIPALGSTSIDLGLRYRKYLDGSAAYDYQYTLSSAPAFDLPCNTSPGGNNSRACTTSLLLRIPSFQRTIIQEKRGISWSGIVVEAGAWFSLVQVVSWIFSGAALNSS